MIHHIAKRDLMKIMERFLKDKDRGISIPMFAEAAGLHHTTLTDVFIHKEKPLSEYVQRRTSKAYQAFAAGELQVMANRDNTRFVQYRRVAKPALKRENRIVFNNGVLQLKIGITNKVNYDQPTLDDQLKGK